MHEEELITLRGGDAEDVFTIGKAALSRVITLEESTGSLVQTIFVTYDNKAVGGGIPWRFDTDGGNRDNHLKALDSHWEALKFEFEELVADADFYHHIKENNEDRASNPLLCEFLVEISNSLLSRDIPNEEFARGEIDQDHYPLTPVSHRMTALRHAVDSGRIDLRSYRDTVTPSAASGMELDVFEQAIMKLDKCVQDTSELYDTGMFGDDEYDGDNEEVFETAGDGAEDEDDDDEKDNFWRSEDEITKTKKDDFWRGGDEHPEKKDDWWSDEEPEGKPGLEADDEDADEKQDLADLLEDYLNYLVDFTNSANSLWIDVVESIYDNKPVTINEKELAEMDSCLEDSITAFKKFQNAAVDLPPAIYKKLIPVFDALEDGKEGPLALMKEIIEMATPPEKASTPARLKYYIEKFLNIQRGRGEAMGM